MATITLDYLGRAVVRNLLDLMTGQTGDTNRRIASVYDALDIAGLERDVAKMLPDVKTDLGLRGYEPREYEVERGDLEWLRDKLQAKNWSSRIGPNGQVVDIPVNAAYIVGVVKTMDAVAEVLAAK